MKLAGIIAEYDPFHSGHAAQLRMLRERGYTHIAVALGNTLSQRGGFYLLDGQARVRAALAAGADLVLSLPAPCSGSGAESFAAAGVHLLEALGCETLAFGAETADTEKLLETARLLLGPELQRDILKNLSGGRTYAAAREEAVRSQSPELAPLLESPNNILGIEYCKAVLRQNTGMRPLALPRLGGGHNSTDAGQEYASGTALRALFRENRDVSGWRGRVPDSVLPLYEEALHAGRFLSEERAEIALLSRLRALGREQLSRIRGVSEGLENRLYEAVHEAPDWQTLTERLGTRRYPAPRLRRLCVDAALGYTGALNGLPPYIHVLGARKEALPLLRGAGLPAGTSLADLAGTGESAAAFAEACAAARDLDALCREKPEKMGLAYTQKPVLL